MLSWLHLGGAVVGQGICCSREMDHCVCSSETDLVREIGIEYMEKVSSERRQGQYIMSRRQRQREKNEHLCARAAEGLFCTLFSHFPEARKSQFSVR